MLYNTTGTCLSFFYNGYIQAELTVITYNEIGEERRLGSVKADLDTAGDDPLSPDWHRHLVELPGGVNRVVIEGVVGSRGAVVMVDDFEIRSCSTFCTVVVIIYIIRIRIELKYRLYNLATYSLHIYLYFR